MFSEWISVSNSIVAGCGRAVTLIRVYMYTACSSTLYRFPDRVVFRQLVDDIMRCSVGSDGSVLTCMQEVAIPLLNELARKKCVSSPKSVVVGAKRFRAPLVSALAKHGCVLDQHQHGRDLGIDTTMGGRRCIGKRFKSALARAAKIKSLSKIAWQANKLQTSGTLPQAPWGFSIKPVAPTRLKQLRAALGGS